MKSRNELQLLLRAVREGVISPILLAEIANSWEPGENPSIVSYLVEHGYLNRDQIEKLESNAKSTAQSNQQKATVRDNPVPDPVIEPTTKSHLDENAHQQADTLVASTRTLEATAPPLSAERYDTPYPYRKGGLGQVWRVRDKLIDREVALKSLRSDRADSPINLARFSREARITGQLEHPSVVPLYDLLYFGEKLCYTMRFLDGRTLAETVADYHKKRQKGEDQALDLTALLDVFVQVCRGVAYAHSRGICHRDVKGQNVILGEFGEVFLVDWGLGKRIDEQDLVEESETKEYQEADEKSLTGPGAIVGTPGYMAPEVASGMPANKSSDIYSLGAVLHTILSGEAPFSGYSARDIMARCQREDPKRVREINPAISPALEAICARALSRNPSERYADANALADDVRRWLADEPVEAFRDPFSVRALRFAKRHRTGVVATGVLLLATVVALSVGSYAVWKEKERTRLQKELAEENFKLAFDASNGGFEVVEFTEPYLSSKPEIIAQKKGALIAGSTAFRKFLIQKPDDENLRTRAARLFRINANVHRFDGELSLADPLYSEALTLAEKQNVGAKAMQAQVLRDWGQSKALQGKIADALALHDRSKTLADRLLADQPNDPANQRLVALNELDRSALLNALNRTKDAEEAAARSVELYQKLDDLPFGLATHPYDALLFGSALTRLAVERRNAGKIDDALKLHSQAVAQYQLYLGKLPKTPNKKSPPPNVADFDVRLFEGVNVSDVYHLVTRARIERAQTQMLSTKTEGVLPMLNAVVDQWNLLIKSNPNSHIYQSSLAHALIVRGDWQIKQKQTDAAKADYQKAREIADDLTKRHKDMPYHFANLGEAWFALAKMDKSADSLSKAESAMKKAVDMSPETVVYQKSLEAIRATRF